MAKKTNRAVMQPSSAEVVASIDDLLIEILLRLPVRSLTQFKSVSKHWLSLITTPQFSVLCDPKLNSAAGLFLSRTAFHVKPRFEYVHFDTKNPENPQFPNLESIGEDPSGLRILQSSNGLLLCSSSGAQEPNQKYFVYNPTTKQYREIQLPESSFENGVSIRGVNLAFDPLKSPFYKVVLICSSESVPDRCQIEIYSSETGSWRKSGEPFISGVDFAKGVYWNGSIHWISTYGDCSPLYFNVEQELLSTMPMPPLPDNCDDDDGRNIAYFGESHDHLQLIELYGGQIQFNVYEMKRDYSEWFVKYQVDLSEAIAAYPRMIRADLQPTNWYYCAFSILNLVRGYREEDSFMVLRIPGKAIRFNLATKTFENLCDFEGADDAGCFPYTTNRSYDYIESLCSV